MLVLASGCGAQHRAVATEGVVTTIQASPQPPPETGLPAHVPLRGHGAADATSMRVIRAWLAALRRGDIAKAAAYFTQPAHVQNGTPVLTLRSRVARLAFNAAFPCGAKARRMLAGPGGFTIVDFVLTERRHGDCMGAAGQPARGAIRVNGHRIAEWYRLPDAPTGGGAPPSPPVVGPGTPLA